MCQLCISIFHLVCKIDAQIILLSSGGGKTGQEGPIAESEYHNTKQIYIFLLCSPGAVELSKSQDYNQEAAAFTSQRHPFPKHLSNPLETGIMRKS